VEIAPGVHAVRLFGSTAFAIVEDEITLIDAGLRGSSRLLRRYLQRLGRSTKDITRIICTHAHLDHIGGVRELVRPELEVYMHPADTERLQITWRDLLARPGPAFVGLVTRGPEDARPVEDGHTFPVLGGLRVIHTPGHTPGSICLYAERDRLLFVGDVLQVIRGKLSPPSHFFSHDLALARRSLERLCQHEVDTICFAHYPPWKNDAQSSLRALVRGF
jgi:glyoxylase-like metal-dependent hydrolase (beta-lactamase superfamily II)